MKNKNNNNSNSTSCTNCSKNVYDDGNIPETDLPKNTTVEPLPESSRPRKDGPGGE